MRLVQRYLWSTNEFEITEKGLKVIKKTLFNYFEHFINYNNISREITHQKVNPAALVLLPVLSIISGLAMLISRINNTTVDPPPLFLEVLIPEAVGFASLVYTLYVKDKMEYVFINGKNQIRLYRNIPDPTTVDLFLLGLFESRKDYLKERYTRIDCDLPVKGQLDNLSALLEQGIINTEEYEILKLQLVK